MRAIVVWVLRALLGWLDPPPLADEPLTAVDDALTSPEPPGVGYRFGYGPEFFEPADAILRWGDDE